MDKKITKYIITTKHYTFPLQVTENWNPLHQFSFLTGNPANPCLEGHITANDVDPRYKDIIETATLTTIDALIECVLHDISEDYFDKYRFGPELLNAIIYFIHSKFPHVKRISLRDASYIPCSRSPKSTLDLLTYSIALHKKTWYEEKGDAYFLPISDYKNYRKQVDIYANEDTKKKIDFNDFHIKIGRQNPFAGETITKNKDIYQIMFDESKTLPDFFIKMNKFIPRNDKCRFFQTWLATFISSQIKIEQNWIIDLYPIITSPDENIVHIGSGRLYIPNRRRETRRCKTSRKRCC